MVSRIPLFAAWASLGRERRKEAISGYLFISPWLIGFIIFFVGPIIASFILSFTQWNIVGAPTWVGLDNYVDIFTSDARFLKAVQVTLTYALFYLPLEVICGIGLALLMNQKLRGIGVFRTLYYMPYVVPSVAASLVWVWMLNGRYGVINTVLNWFGAQGPNWLENPATILPSLIMIALWGVGGTSIIYLAGLQNIPEVMYEAATVDGANRWQSFFRITLPLLSPTIFFQLVLGLIGVFQTFTPAFIAAGANGGPLQSGLFYMLYVYNRGFVTLRMGYASALAWILTIFILVVTVAVLRSSRYWVHYETDRSTNR
ncbi:MAG: sugar ABC transporter permease [Anaerolineae bacterium]|nr:sugar ABC transporter permease [Chloroflexota bacterium]MBN8635414.1 sugar ABC transporter permease [Anaerolineae bacterium]